MRKVVMKACKDLGFTDFIEAEDGQQAWTVLNDSTTAVGLIISDWNMPNCSGLDFLKRVRSNGLHKDKPFVLLTAENETTQVQAAVVAGVDSYIVKPFSTDSLRQKLEQVYQKRSAA